MQTFFAAPPSSTRRVSHRLLAFCCNTLAKHNRRSAERVRATTVKSVLSRSTRKRLVGTLPVGFCPHRCAITAGSAVRNRAAGGQNRGRLVRLCAQGGTQRTLWLARHLLTPSLKDGREGWRASDFQRTSAPWGARSIRSKGGRISTAIFGHLAQVARSKRTVLVSTDQPILFLVAFSRLRYSFEHGVDFAPTAVRAFDAIIPITGQALLGDDYLHTPTYAPIGTANYSLLVRPNASISAFPIWTRNLPRTRTDHTCAMFEGGPSTLVLQVVELRDPVKPLEPGSILVAYKLKYRPVEAIVCRSHAGQLIRLRSERSITGPVTVSLPDVPFTAFQRSGNVVAARSSLTVCEGWTTRVKGPRSHDTCTCTVAILE